MWSRSTPTRSTGSGGCTPCRPTCPVDSATPIRTRSSSTTSCGCSGAAGGWNPTFSYTEDGTHWVPARELVRFGHGQRPYAKYVGDAENRIHMICTDGHPSSWKNSLHYLRYESNHRYAVGGRRLGSL